MTEEAKRYGKLQVVIAQMNPDLAMGDELLKKTGAGNLFMVFGEPDGQPLTGGELLGRPDDGPVGVLGDRIAAAEGRGGGEREQPGAGVADIVARPGQARVERLAGAADSGSDVVRVRGRVLQQAFHGATELIRVECADGLVLVARISSGRVLHHQVDIEFSPTDAILVRESPERS